MQDKNEVLKRIFGYDAFRDGQSEIIDSIVGGRDTLCVMSTGAGKSICYQIPAIMLPGITIVISPLISLMQDQVLSLIQMGMPAAFINSSLQWNECMQVMNDAGNGKYKILYVAPERLSSESFISRCRQIEISLIAVDEAHCVSQWGNNFRPDYRKIPDFADALGTRPVIAAFTATATPRVKEDIAELLQLHDPFSVTTGFDRPNLYFGVINTSNSGRSVLHEKDRQLLRLVKERSDQSGIIYCSTRKNVERVSSLLQEKGYDAVRYHAGLTKQERNESQERFINDDAHIIVATTAFGMGIDKSNVSFVIHYNLPKDIESYYQEAGRAGRDGSRADCILLYSSGDVRTIRYIIDNADEDEDLAPDLREALKAQEYERLKYMTFYATTSTCLRSYILNYFGEKTAQKCDNCSNCLDDAELSDATVDAQKILSCIVRCHNASGRNYGRRMIENVLRGKSDEKSAALGFDKLSTFGIMKDYTLKKIRILMSAVISQGLTAESDGNYPVLEITGFGVEVLKGSRKVEVRLPEEKDIYASGTNSGRLPGSTYGSGGNTDVDRTLFIKLKLQRSKIAKEAGLPPFYIFSDASLRDMCRKLPSTEDEFLDVSGVGEKKLNSYGSQFINVIRNYISETGK